MKAMQRTTLMLALAGALSMPALSFAADAAKDEHGGHHPEAAPVTAGATIEASTPAAADRMQTMRQRMMEMRATQDPAKRMQLMDAQMKDVETMMQAPKRSCPKADAKGGMGMMGGKGGMGMMGQGMQGGMGMSGQDDMMAKRMEMMEKRMDMMQMMMQMRIQGMGGGMGMPSN